MPPPLGIIITVSILAAAALAAYENDKIRAWLDQTRQKIAMGLHNLGDEIQPRRKPLSEKSDASMSEDQDDAAEQRRRRARQEIMERGRMLEARRKRRSTSGTTTGSQSPSFDSLVDNNGKLISESVSEKAVTTAETTAVEAVEPAGAIRSRHQISIDADMRQSVDATIPVRHFPQQQAAADAQDPFESMYEREMRQTWNLQLPPVTPLAPSSHASESLIDLTPTTEDFPDPDYSIPSGSPRHRAEHSDYFSAAGSRASCHTLSDHEPQYYYAHPTRPLDPIQPRQATQVLQPDMPMSSVASVAGSADYVHPSEADVSDDDLISEPDGIKTPASGWTEVESVVSAEN